MTTDPTPTARVFDWNEVGDELDALSEAIAETIDQFNPMQTNESTMECLEHLWSLGFRVVRIPDATEATDPLAARVAALEGLWARAITEAHRLLGERYYTVPDLIAAIDAALLPPADGSRVESMEMPSGKCPVCWSDATFRLPSDWQDRVERGQSVPIVGCGNPWHYDHFAPTLERPAPTTPTPEAPAARCSGCGTPAMPHRIPCCSSCSCPIPFSDTPAHTTPGADR
jgi:hypothetical protein